MRLSVRQTVGWLYLAAVITAYADEESKEAADALRRASDVVLKARKASDLDASLIELRHLAYAPELFQLPGPQRESAQRRLHDAARFLQQWQNYLWAAAGGKFDNGIRILTDLAQSEQNPLDVPRSEILARTRTLEAEDKAQRKASPRPLCKVSVHSTIFLTR
jgi:hypothetical protein